MDLLQVTWLATPTLAAGLLLAQIPRHDGRCANLARQLHPLTFELPPRLAIDPDRGQQTSARLTKAQANCLRWIATRGLEFGRDFVVVARVDHARWPEVSASAFDAAYLAGAQPLAWDGLADEQRVALFTD